MMVERIVNGDALRRASWLRIPWLAVAKRVQAVPVWERYAGAGLIGLATLLDFTGLTANGFGNAYYAAAVKSMLTSWRAFFFASFDPVGFVSVDKPPLGLWIQVLSAKLFGFNSFSLLLPEALAGVLSVALLYHLVRRTFGGAAGLLAGLFLAISPITVVANRDNIFESLLVLTTLLAAWAAIKATETGDFRWLALSGVFIGLGFNIKMLEAYLILPACMLVFLVGAPGVWRRRLALLAATLGIVIVVSFWWITIVDLTPASQRPYVDSTLSNSELDLALNYNGWQRLFGQPHYKNATAHAISDAGAPSLLRLFQPHLGGQVSWFLPLALIGALASIWGLSLRFKGQRFQAWRRTPRHQSLVFWATWLATTGVFFTVAQFYNRYYLVMLAPAICALAAVGVVGLWRDYRRPGWRGWLLPLAVFATGAEQRVILTGYADWRTWLSPFVYAATAFVVFLLVGLRLMRPQSTEIARALSGWRGTALLGLTLATLAIAPLFWLGVSFGVGNDSAFPVSGPVAGGSSAASTVDPRLIAYLEAHARRLPFLVATLKVNDATPIIFATGDAVMAMGGYSGYDPILTPASLARLVARHEVRFFLLPASNLTLAEDRTLYPASAATFHTSYTNRETQWVSQACAAVPPQTWKTNSALSTTQLFDCAGVT